MSGRAHEMKVDLAGVIAQPGAASPVNAAAGSGEKHDQDFGVAGGAALREFALALVQRSGVSEARARVIGVLGPDAVAAASGVVGAFEAVNRVADATGTKLDDMIARALDGPLAGLGIETMKTD